jgi:Tfp pilus assembly pilus retraction ATPase PilT
MIRSGNIILVGEMTGLETIELDLEAVSTGHLVLAHLISGEQQKIFK